MYYFYEYKLHEHPQVKANISEMNQLFQPIAESIADQNLDELSQILSDFDS